MSYQPENLSALSYANGFTLWHYRTADALFTVVQRGYFDAARMLRVGDSILVNASISFGEAPVNGQLWVQRNTNDGIKVGGSINTDTLINKRHA